MVSNSESGSHFHTQRLQNENLFYKINFKNISMGAKVLLDENFTLGSFAGGGGVSWEKLSMEGCNFPRG